MLSNLEGIAWPAHHHPILVGQETVYYCDPARHCRHTGLLPVLDRTEAAAITVAPDGQLFIATATPDGDQVSLRLVRCEDIDCAEPRVTALGTVPGSTEQGDTWITRMMAAAVDRDGRPVVAFRTQAGVVFVAWCVTPACDGGEVTAIGEPKPSMPDLAPLDDTGLVGCITDVCAVNAPTPTVMRPGGGRYEVLVEERPADGVRLQLGARAEVPLHTTLLACRDDRCRDADRIAVHDGDLGSSNWPRPYVSEMWMLAANPDGRVIMVRPGYIPHMLITVRP